MLASPISNYLLNSTLRSLLLFHLQKEMMIEIGKTWSSQLKVHNPYAQMLINPENVYHIFPKG